MLPKWSVRALVLSLIVITSLSVGWVISAQDDMVEMPEALVEGIEALSEDYPELVDIEWTEYSDYEITLWLPESFEQTLVEDLLEFAQVGSNLIDPEFEPFIRAELDAPDTLRFLAMNRTGLEVGDSFNLAITRLPALNTDALVIFESFTSLVPDSVKVRQEPVSVKLDNFDSVAYVEWEYFDKVSISYGIVDVFYLYTMSLTTVEEYIEFDQIVAELAIQTLVIDREDEE